MRRQYLSLRGLFFVIASRRRSNLIICLITLALCYVLPPVVSAQEMPALNVYAQGPYEVWGGDEPCPDITVEVEDGKIITVPGYYDAPRFGYVFLGQSDSADSFYGNYKYYVIATRSLFKLDAVERPDGTFIIEESHDPLVTWGNVHRPYEFCYVNCCDENGCYICLNENGCLIGDPMDYVHDEYIYGPPDGLTDDVGLVPGHGYAPGGQFQGFVVVEVLPKLFVTIPGINDHGEMMIEGAKKMVRYDDECKVFIMEKLRPSITAVKKAVANASKKAKEKGKDVVVLIDMDLENYTWEFPLPPFLNRWKRSVSWAGRRANVVSEAFSKEAPGGKRILYAHSAGGDATKQSIAQSRSKRMYDNINILNGRTCAVTWLFGFVCRDSLASVLKRCGYGWWQVKVFTNDGDLPANPNWSLSNYDVAKQEAGASWVHLHCCDITGHSALRDSIPGGIEGTFEVNLSPKTGSPNCTEVATVEDLMTRDWR